MASSLDPEAEARFIAGVERAQRFFMRDSDVHHALYELTAELDRARIPYAIVGGLALNEHGYQRVTIDIDVLLTRAGLDEFKRLYLGRGYLERFPGSKNLRDTRHNVDIDVLLAGDFPGDGKPKPVQFPDPAVAERGERFSVLSLAKIIELKIASGMTARHRLRDLADVIALIKARALPEALAEELDPYVRDRYRELWVDAQAAAAEE